MKIIRCEDNEGRVRYGIETAEGMVAAEGDPFNGLAATGEPLEEKRRLAPVAPTTIYAIGLNYRRHAEEMGVPLPEYPVLFMKSPTAVQDPGAPIELPRTLRSDQVDYEVELAVVIGRACKNIAAEDALDYVAGYTCANDVSARDWQKIWSGGQWCRGKTFDTFCPLGPVLVTPDEIPDPDALGVRSRVNGELRQDSNTSDLIFSVRELIAFLSGSTMLLPGTVILTGTPEGVGMAMDPPCYLEPGDRVDIEIEGIGVLSNPVVEEPVPG